MIDLFMITNLLIINRYGLQSAVLSIYNYKLFSFSYPSFNYRVKSHSITIYLLLHHLFYNGVRTYWQSDVTQAVTRGVFRRISGIESKDIPWEKSGS
jgi:hypothetical protein